MMSAWKWRKDESASGWFVRLRAQPITRRLDAKFKRWLAADPANEQSYERRELAWEVIGELEGDREIAALVAEAERSTVPMRRSRMRRPAVVWSAVAACALIVIIGWMFTWMTDVRVYATAVGEQRTVELPDHSRVTLNTDTRIRVAYKGAARVIELEHGEATFSVVRDPARPFEVRAADGIARALGTKFNVFAAAGGVTVSVLSGTVAVVAPPNQRATANQGRSATLTTGQEVTYRGAELSNVHVAKVARIEAWHSGRVAFEDAALDEVLVEFNRYSSTPIVLGDASLASRRVTGVFRVGESDALLAALSRAFGICSERTGATITLKAYKC